MNAQSAVAEALRRVNDYVDVPEDADLAAKVALDALRANNFEVVELVESYPDEGSDFYPAPPEWMVETPDHRPGMITHDGSDEPLTPTHARDLARAFLSAARDIERGKR